MTDRDPVRGEFGVFGLMDIACTLTRDNRTAKVSLSASSGNGAIWFARGRVVAAEDVASGDSGRSSGDDLVSASGRTLRD